MAVRLVPSSVACSASAGVVQACTAYNLSADPTSSSQFRDDLGTQRTSGTFTIPNGNIVSGCGIWFQTLTRAGFFNIKLQKGGVDVAGATFSIAVNSTNFPAGYGFRTFAFTTPATGDGSSTYTLVARCTTLTAFGGSAQNNSIFWFRDSTAGNYSYLTVDNTDAATGITSGDTLVLDKGVQLTIDQNTTLAPLATDKPSLWLGDGASFKVTATGYTLDLGAGCVEMASNGYSLVGTSGTPMAAGLNFIVKTGISTGQSLFRAHYVLANNGDTSRYHEWYGATSDSFRLHIGSAYSGSNAAGQAKVTFSDEIPGTWAVTDSIHIMGKDQTGGDSQNAGAYYTIAAAGIDAPNKTITLNTNIGTKLITDFPGIVVNVTELTRCMGIQIQSTNNIFFDAPNQQAGNDQMHHVVLKGIYSQKCQLGTRELIDAGTAIDGYVVEFGANNPTAPSVYCSYPGGSTVNNLIIFSRGTGGNDQFTVFGKSIAFSNVWIQALGSAGSGSTTGIQCNSSTFTNCGAVNQTGVAKWVTFNYSGYGNTFTNVNLIGASHRVVGNSSIFTNVNQQRAVESGTMFQNSVANVFNNCTFGVGTSNGTGATYDIDVNLSGFNYSPTFIQAVFNNCNVGGRGVNATQTALMNQNSYLQFHNYNATVGDHRTYKRLGTFTTPSPYTTLVQEVNQSTSYLSHQFSLLSQTIANKQHYLVLTGQVAAAYYAGTHAVPKVDIYTDGNSATPLATLSLADSNSTAQLVSQSFTPTTSNNQIVLDFQTKTDATGTNADCTWSGVSIRQRIYGQTYTSSTLGITETLTYPIATLTTPTANSYITQATQSTVHAYTGIAINSGTKVVTVTATHTIEELYDYIQDYLSLNPTVDEWFTTVDGVTFTMTNGWAVTVSGAVKLTSTARKIAYTGGGALTLSSGALYEDSAGVQFDVSGTVYYASHFYINCKKASDGTTNIQTCIVSFIDSGGNDRTYNTSLSNGSLVTDSSGNVEGYAVYKIGSTTYTGHKLQIGHYSYNWLQIPTTVSGTAIGSSGSYTTELLTADAAITLSQATVDAYTGITVNQSTKAVNMNSYTLSQVMHYLKSQQTKTAEIDTTNHIKGFLNFYTVSGYSDTGLILRYDLTNYHGAYGWTFSSSGYGGTLFLKDGSGTVTSAATQIALTGLVSGSTVQIYDSTSSSELYNAVVGATSLTYQYTWTANDTIRIRCRYAVGTTGYLPYEYTQAVTNTGLSLVVSQQSDSIYNANNITGTGVTEFSLSGGTIKIYVNDPDNATTGQRMYNWYMAAIATTTYIGVQPVDVTAQTAWSYVLADAIQLYNQSVTPLFITGANINNVSGNGQVIDTAGGIININGYFPFNSAADVGSAVWLNSKALTVPKFIALK